MKYFLFFIFISTFLKAEISENCDDCSPLAEVSITNSGLEKIISLSVDENLKSLDRRVVKSAKFRDVKLDRSSCKVQKISEAWKNKKSEDNCYGLPNIDDTGFVDGNTELRPYTAEIKNFKINKMDLALAAPVKCKNFVCNFEIRANAIDISGDFGVTYTDKQEVFIPSTPITLKTTENTDVRMTGQVLIEPRTGQINDLMFLDEKKLKFKIAPSALTLDMPIQKEFASKEEEIRLKSKNFHRYVPVNTIDDKYIDLQYEQMRFHLSIQTRNMIEAKRSAEGLPELPWQKLKALSEKETDQIIQKKYGSAEQYKAKLKAIKWPSPHDERGTYEFIQNPPPELSAFQDISDKMDFAKIAAIGENSGFNNGYAFLFTLAAVQVGQMAADDGYITGNFIQPMLEKEVLPVVYTQVNSELRSLRQYWNQISKIPNLNTQNLQVLSDLKSQLKAAENSDERERLQQKIFELEQKMASDWISIDTEVVLDQNTRSGKLLKAQITKSNPYCSTLPKVFSNDDTDDFDVRTQFGVNTLQDYFNRMSQNNNLNLCIDSNDPLTCKGGTKINLKNAPKIGCENGDFTFEIDAEAASKILGMKISTGLNSKIKAKINNCSGSPCIQFSDSNGRFKNVFLNTFFGNMLDRGLSTALAKSNNIPVNVPHLKMKKTQSASKDCTTKLDWSIE